MAKFKFEAVPIHSMSPTIPPNIHTLTNLVWWRFLCPLHEETLSVEQSWILVQHTYLRPGEHSVVTFKSRILYRSVGLGKVCACGRRGKGRN